jgi:NAD(P)-dependent dehydrogenase (short-subunit alcohol dehydrogenase family)
VFVTGSVDGIGRQTAQMLVTEGHRVVLHARNEERSRVGAAAVPGAAGIAIGELASLSQTRDLANSLAGEHFDAIVHNAGVGGSGRRHTTEDGLERIFQINVLAPYVLTALMPLPARLIYLTSGLASDGVVDLTDLQRERRRWSGNGAYCDSKLCDLALALAVARRYPEVVSTAVCPGWVRSRMGGPGAPTDLQTGAATQVWLALSQDPEALRSGRYMRHMRVLEIPRPAAEVELQDGLLAACAELSAARLPE